MAATTASPRTTSLRDDPAYQAYFLLLGGHLDIALRDLGLLLGALALARLATAFRPVREGARAQRR